MKNKKLFAILTLVCFMFTLMPVAAFADTDMQVYVDGKAEAEVVAGAPFVASTTDSAVYFVVNEDGEGVAVAGKDGKFAGIKTAGDYKVYALAATKAIEDYVASVASPAEKVATLEAAYADGIDAFDYAELTVVMPDLDYRITFKGDKVANNAISIAANNGFNAGDNDNVVAVLEKSVDGKNWSAVKDQELTLTTVGYVDAEFVDGAKTDKKGEAEFEVTSGTAGEYKVIAKWNKVKATLSVKVVAGYATKVVVNNEPEAPVNIDNDTVQAAGVEFKFTDANGAAAAYEAVEITLVEKPATSKLKSENFKLVADDKAKDGVYDLDGKNVFDKEGTYKIKVALENGVSATATVKVSEMGDVVAIKFVDAPATVAYDVTPNNEKTELIGDGVVGVDAEGVIGEVEGVKYSYVGKAVKAFDADGKVTLKCDEDYIGTIVTVYAVYEAANGDVFTVSNEVVVTDAAAAIKYLSTEAEVGVTTTLAANLVDANGNKVVAEKPATVKYIVLDKPENAIAVVTGSYGADDKNLVYTKLLASVAGEYQIQTIVVTADNKYISSVDTFTVGVGEGTFKDIVVMSIGANKIVVNNEVKVIDCAPVVENNRTFVPFRALAEAFGAVVNYDEATQSVTAELNGTTVVMTIGSAEYTVNGVVKTADVAPFVKDSRTMVPVRFAAEAFGINVTPVYGENGATVDVLFAK